MTKEFDRIIGFHVCDPKTRDPECPQCGKEFIVPASAAWMKKYGDNMMTTRACRCCKREQLLRCDVIICQMCSMFPEYNTPNKDIIESFALEGEDREKAWFYKFKFLQEDAEDRFKENEYIELAKNLKEMPKEQKIEIYKALNPVLKTKRIKEIIDENSPKNILDPSEKIVECRTHHFNDEKQRKCDKCEMMYYNFCLDGTECNVHSHVKTRDEKQ
jgi:hypothetical protein|tara:strand:- start:251 stop:898 length:648 start_codon:yes stop_codon:yes gene_type:complete